MVRSKIFAATVFGLALASSGFMAVAHAEDSGGQGYDGSGLVPTDVEIQHQQVSSSRNDGQRTGQQVSWSGLVSTEKETYKAS